MQMPMPDFVLCCNNICNCMTKWYENIARMHNIPLVMLDIPYNNTVEVDDTYVAYIRGQFDAAIEQLEKISGRKFDEEKFQKACAYYGQTMTSAVTLFIEETVQEYEELLKEEEGGN